ncbi:MAG: hypothetical protein CMJ39_02325, partial [Phycisphaerae bacterium]|nr:hypothetical protein [Phycisphaerae bacterium]
KPIYNGLDLNGWKPPKNQESNWASRGGILFHNGKGGHLWTDDSYGDFDLVVDWRWTDDHQGEMERPIILPDGSIAIDEDGKQRTMTVEERDSGIFLRGNSKSQVNLWCWPIGSGEVYGYRTDGSMTPEVRAAVTPRVNADQPVGKWNRYFIRMRGDRLTVVLNGKTVIDQAQLPGVPNAGPIGLQSHGNEVEFRNLLIRER